MSRPEEQDEQFEDVTPGPRKLIRIFQNQASLNWSLILCELIDNAFDAGASRVDLELRGRDLIVVDDGAGCGREGMLALINLGGHHEHDTTTIGTYGIGGKEAAIWLNARAEYTSICKGLVWSAEIDWPTIDTWRVPKVRSAPAQEATCRRYGLRAEGGMSVRLVGIDRHRRIPTGRMLADRVRDIGATYTPALRDGKQIVFRQGRKRLTATGAELPAFEMSIDEEVEVAGRSVRLICGVVRAETEHNHAQGLAIHYGNRVIERRSAIGCGGYSTARIAGELHIGRAWTLDKNKTRLNEASKLEALDAALRAKLGPLLMRAESQTRSIQLSELTGKINDSLQAEWPATKARRRGKGDKSGTVKPRGTGRKHGQAVELQPGDKSMRKKGAGVFRLDFCNDPGAPVWSVTDGRVYLNRAISWVDRLVRLQAEEALKAIALIAYAADKAATSDGTQLVLPMEEAGSTFDSRLAQIVTRIAPTAASEAGEATATA